MVIFTRDRIKTLIVISILLSFSLISGCLGSDKDDSKEDEEYENGKNGEVTIPETTKQLSGNVLDSISSISEDASEIVFQGSPSGISDVEDGDVLSFGIGEKTPYGLLRKVVDIQSSDTDTTLITEQATLEDAVEEGRLEYNQTLTSPSKILESVQGVLLEEKTTRSDDDGIVFENVVLYEGEEGGRIILNGFLDLDFELIFDLTLEDFTIKECNFGTLTTFNGELDITSDGDFEFDVEIEVARFEYTPIIIPMGEITVIIVPVLSLVIGSEGTVSSGLSVKAEENVVIDASVEHPDWKPQKEFTPNFGYTTPSMGDGLSVICYTGPEMSLLIYGVVGPYVTAHGYINGETDNEGYWWLYGGLRFGLGFKIEVLGVTIKEWEKPDFINFSRLIASSMDDLASGWVVEKVDYGLQLTDPLLAEDTEDGLILVYHSIDPDYYPIKMAILKDGVWSFQELVYTNDYDLMDITLNEDNHVLLAYYAGGYDQKISLVEWDGSSVVSSEFSDPDMAGNYISDLRIVTDELDRTNIYYVLTKEGSSSNTYSFMESTIKKAVYDEGSFSDDTLFSEDGIGITGLDIERASDGTLHITYMMVRTDEYKGSLIHSKFSQGEWSNYTVFRENITWKDPGNTHLEIDSEGNPCVIFDGNLGGIYFYRFENGNWMKGESPAANVYSDLVSLHLLGGSDPVCSYMISSGQSYTLYYSALRNEGWDRVVVFEWTGWRWPGGTDISETDESIIVAYNDGLYTWVARKDLNQ